MPPVDAEIQTRGVFEGLEIRKKSLDYFMAKKLFRNGYWPLWPANDGSELIALTLKTLEALFRVDSQTKHFFFLVC